MASMTMQGCVLFPIQSAASVFDAEHFCDYCILAIMQSCKRRWLGTARGDYAMSKVYSTYAPAVTGDPTRK